MLSVAVCMWASVVAGSARSRSVQSEFGSALSTATELLFSPRWPCQQMAPRITRGSGSGTCRGSARSDFFQEGVPRGMGGEVPCEHYMQRGLVGEVALGLQGSPRGPQPL
jgi:hypothetical protein